ncbi:MAG: hypothetical protein J0J04_04950 [Microbacterium sp.]|uniref:hypothetical protein n=1 Tax=Microbacterium sp. TaxID=51671 RepID=UPI001AD4E5CF|nr:hypothetical protein [Microbacterium sp.]MBN9214156.1 hypothetical protein [Microbacterium sp.]
MWDGHRTIPTSRFGSDHWHLLLHLQESGSVRRKHWRDGPTLLADAELHGHTDYDVIRDLAAADLVHPFMEERRLSSAGRVVRAELVEHLRGGGNFSNFRADVVVTRLAS